MGTRSNQGPCGQGSMQAGSDPPDCLPHPSCRQCVSRTWHQTYEAARGWGRTAPPSSAKLKCSCHCVPRVAARGPDQPGSPSSSPLCPLQCSNKCLNLQPLSVLWTGWGVWEAGRVWRGWGLGCGREGGRFGSAPPSSFIGLAAGSPRVPTCPACGLRVPSAQLGRGSNGERPQLGWLERLQCQKRCWRRVRGHGRPPPRPCRGPAGRPAPWPPSSGSGLHTPACGWVGVSVCLREAPPPCPPLTCSG